MLEIIPTGPGEFVAHVRGVDLRREVPQDQFRLLEQAFETFAVLVFNNQPIDEPQQLAFATRFGPIEPVSNFFFRGSDEVRRLAIREFADISNLDEHGKLLDAADPRQLSIKANQMWHTDSSFKRTPAKMSMLAAQSVVERGGETEFADMRAVWRALPASLRKRLDGCIGEHDFYRSRTMVGLDPMSISPQRRASLPPVPQVLIRTSPATGQKSIYLASHLKRIYGVAEAESRTLLDELMDFATSPEFVYSHRWAVDDVVMWDNRCTMHRGMPFDPNERRAMRRATVMDSGPTVPMDWSETHAVLEAQ